MPFPSNPNDNDYYVENGTTWVYVNPPGVWTKAGGTPLFINYTETDPLYASSPAGSITNTDVNNWNAELATAKTVEKQYRYEGALGLSTGSARLYVPANCTGTDLKLHLGTASSSGDVTVDFLLNGVVDTTATITELSTTADATSATAITEGDYVTIDITGAGTGAADLYISLTFTRA